jgi:hypothetical protein
MKIFSIRGSLLYSLFAGALSVAVPISTSASPHLVVTINPVTRRVLITAQGLAGGLDELRLVTPGLAGVETSSEVNEPGELYLPAPEGGWGGLPPAENVFFFNDLAPTNEWEMVARFASDATGTWKLNGRFSPDGGKLVTRIAIPSDQLEAGENLLHYQASPLPAVPRFYYRRRLPVENDRPCSVTVDRADWSGVVQLVQLADDGTETVVATAEVAGPAPVRREVPIAAQWWKDRAALDRAVLDVGKNLLHARVMRPDSLFYGGFNLVYDARKKSYRMPHWIWSWGPAIQFLLDLGQTDAAKQAGLASEFHAAALAAGRRSLAFGVTDPRHIAAGISTVRWEPSHATPNGWVEYISTADSLFLSGWGWMSLYAETREPVYLERTRTLVAAAERLMAQYPVVPQDWIVERQRWTPHTLDESVFGMAGFARLFAATKSPEVAAAGQRFLDSHLQHMGGKNGLLQRAWMRDEDKAVWEPDIKGHGWVLEGYLDAYRLTGSDKYLRLARSLADQVLACQGDDGAWTSVFQKPSAKDPRDGKATAIWAYLLYDFYHLTHDERHLAAARAALGWCLRCQYHGDDANLEGGILSVNAMAYIRPRPMTILYTTTFFGLALLEELALSPGN